MGAPVMGLAGSGAYILKNLAELFWFKHSQLQQAVRAGHETLVSLLDREVDAALMSAFQYEAMDAAETHLQFQLFIDLQRVEADDPSCVLKLSAMLQALVQRYFGSKDEERAGSPLKVRARASDMEADDSLLNEDVLEQIPGRVSVVTTDYRYLYSNPSNAAHLKTKPMDLIGRHITDFIGPQRFHARVKAELDRCFSGELIDYCFTRETDGQTMVMNCRMSPCLSVKGELVGAILVLNEIADRRRSSEAA